MATTRDGWEGVLREPQRHTAQLYTTSAFLGDAVGLYLAEGARRGETGIVFATPEHYDVILGGMRRRGAQPDELFAAGRLVFCDASATLAAILRDRRIDRVRIDEEVGGLLRRHAAKGTAIRVYGELVMLLWRDGNASAAIEVEQIWNGLLETHRMSLLCGYHVDSIAGSYPTFADACREHHQVLPSERSLDQTGLDHLTSLARLEHQTRELHARDQLLKSMFDSSRDCITVLDTDARLLFMSEVGLASLELWDFEMVRGKSWLELWHGADRVAATAAFDAACAGTTNEFIGFFETLMRKRPRWWSVVLSPIRGAAGNVHQILAVWCDVTDRKRLEEDLRRSIDARDQFLAIASHELRRPIMAMQTQLKKARAGSEPGDRLDTILAETASQVGRLARLVESLAGVSSIHAGRLSVLRVPADLSLIVSGVHARYRDDLAAADSAVTLSLADDVQGEWDVDRLEQVIENLLVNAINYAPGAAVTLTTRRNEATVHLIVADRGPGIPREKQHVIFDRFERIGSARSSGGLGLGLFIVKQLVEAHEGRVHVEPTEGGGATFVVELPVKAVGAAPVISDHE